MIFRLCSHIIEKKFEYFIHFHSMCAIYHSYSIIERFIHTKNMRHEEKHGVRNLLKKESALRRHVAHNLLKNQREGKVSFMDLGKFHYNLLCI